MPFLQMRGISKRYGGTQALRAVDFSAAAPHGKAAPPAAASEPIPDTIEYRPEPKKK